MIRLFYEKGEVPVKSFKFPAGELQVKVHLPPGEGHEFTIEAHLHSSDDIMELFLVTDSIFQQAAANTIINLRVPYLPYARQDRVCAPGEAFSLSVMVHLLNVQGYHSIEVWDVHSNEALKCFVDVKNISAKELIQRKGFVFPKSWVVVSPDEGSHDRAYGVASISRNNVMIASKRRDASTGVITGTEIKHMPDPWHGTEDCLIVDDICDGGKTFVELAKVLRTLTTGKIMLYVTHGIFSKGLGVFDGLIDHIWCANPIGKQELSNKLRML